MPLALADFKQATAYLNERYAQAHDEQRLAKQRSKGKLTVWERIAHLTDAESFLEIGAFSQARPPIHAFGKQAQSDGDGVVTGRALINGRQVFIYAQDFSQMGGSLGLTHAKKIVHIMDIALQQGSPIIGLLDSGGARIQEGIASLEGYAEIFRKNTELSGIIPQISVILGPCAGGASYSPALTDFIFMVENISTMFITGPKVIKTVTGEDVTTETLGGVKTHTERSGVAHFSYRDEKSCLTGVKNLLRYLPQHCTEDRGKWAATDNPTRSTAKLLDIIPTEQQRPYDVRDVIKEICDQESFLEIQPDFAPNVVIGFAVLNGNGIGIVANQTSVLAGCLDIDASVKIARFVRFCNAFRIPLINFVDTPGYLPGIEQEYGGIIRHGAKVLSAYAEATVPKIAIVLRKAYGGAYIAMASASLGYDLTLALPSAQIAVMGKEQAIDILYGKELAQSDNPEALAEEKGQEYAERVLHPYAAAELGYVDRIISPENLRPELCRWVDTLRNKTLTRGKHHGNIPL